MRLIDADEVFCSDCEWKDQCENVVCDVKVMPTIDPESIRPQWVSIYDKLPPEGERVLATDGAFVGEMYINKRGQWRRYNVNNIDLMMALDILWWLPMPQPPEMKGAGDNE